MAARLPAIYVRGDNYQVGIAMGENFKHVIQTQLVDSQCLNKTLWPLYSSDEGKRQVDRYLEASCSYYPQYVDELKGIAAGAEVDFIKLFLLHLEVELLQHIGTPPREITAEGCSDLLLNGPQTSLLAHSEDVAPEACDAGYVVHVHVLPTERNGHTEERFTAYSYPGSLQGNTLAFNRHGLVITLNILFQEKSNECGIPRRIVNRAALTARNVEEVAAIVCKGPGVATGFNYNLAQNKPDGTVEMVSMEVYGVDGRTEMNISTIQGFDHHFNDYRRIELPWKQDPSSAGRTRRLSVMLKEMDPKWIPDLCDIMGDTEDKLFPFYRNGRHPDYLATGCVGIFDMKAGKLHVYRSNPHSTPCIASFSITCAP